MDTCYSGSMFIRTPENVGIYGVSAANTYENSYSIFCYPGKINQSIYLN